MELAWPWGLVSLLPILAAAVWAMRRPLHRVVRVSSLRLWERALEALGPSAARRARRVTAAWVVLLAAAAVAGVALSRPRWHRARPARRVAVAVVPSAELGPAGIAAMKAGARVLLGRLDAVDRVRFILPAAAGGASEFLAPAEAARRIGQIEPLPVPADELRPIAAPDVQHVYRLAAATLPAADAAGVTTIALPAVPGEVTIDAFGVDPLPGGAAEVFVALRNHADRRRRGAIRLAGETGRDLRRPFDLPARGRGSLVVPLPAAGGYVSATIEAAAGFGAAAFAVRRASAVRAVAMIGRDDPLLRRFVKVHPALRLAGQPEAAELIFAVGAAAGPDKPALVIDPPAPPPGWSARAAVTNLALRDADLLEDHPVMTRGGHTLDLSAVAIRRAAGWQGEADAPGSRLVAFGPSVLVLAGERPRRVYVSFDVSAENTNFGLTPAFVIFLANAVAYLAPEAGGEERYGFLTPHQAGRRGDWRPLNPARAAVGGLPGPGLYRDAAGEVRAVSLPGLGSARPEGDPLTRARQAPLPAPEALAQPVELWPGLALLAAVLWLAGWTLRLR